MKKPAVKLGPSTPEEFWQHIAVELGPSTPEFWQHILTNVQQFGAVGDLMDSQYVQLICVALGLNQYAGLLDVLEEIKTLKQHVDKAKEDHARLAEECFRLRMQYRDAKAAQRGVEAERSYYREKLMRYEKESVNGSSR